jgi:uncharacterized protein (TIGR02231 family)
MKNLSIIAFSLVASYSSAQKPIVTQAKTNHATVYYTSAELTQTAAAILPTGTSEIVIRNVANYVIENTIQIAAPSTLTVLSVQFVPSFEEGIEVQQTEKRTPLQQKYQDSIHYFENEISKIQVEKITKTQTMELLEKKEVAGTTKPEITISEFKKLVEYYQTKRNELGLALHNLSVKEIKLQNKISVLNEKLVPKKVTKTGFLQGNLLVQVMNTAAGMVAFELSYLTNGASWQPFYDLRAEKIDKPISFIYKAKVTQNTGINWEQVKLTLSSGSPNQNNNAPILQAWFLQFGFPVAPTSRNVVMNSLALKKSEDEAEEGVGAYTTIVENQLTISFDIDIPYTILSNGKTHSVAMKELKIPATYKYYAIPKAEKEAFLLAEIADYSKYNLLPGEANIIFEGLYVGKTMINPNQTADTLNLSMGRDKKISINREKIIDKSGTKFLSGYKEQLFTYDITVKNNKKETIEMLLKDQFPISTDQEITIALVESSRAKVTTEIGILNWEIKLAPNESKKIRISYKVNYPKDKNIANL